MPVNYDAIPKELHWDNNWCVAGPDDNGRYRAPHLLDGRKLFRVSPTTPQYWRDLETTIESAESCPPCGIGYVLSPSCGYTVIDLDVKNANNYPNDPDSWTTAEQLDRFWKIVQEFDSYTERSASGQGLHIWVKGSIGPGAHGRDGVEVYSQDRFIVTTGDVLFDKPIANRQELLEILVDEIRMHQAGHKVELVELEATESDEVILQRAYEAENGEKFAQLMQCTSCTGFGDKKIQGTYVDLGYPSQSEADLALMSIFTFYSKSNEQCRRLFRMSGLATRKKATKNNTYLDFTLQIIRGRQEAEEVVDEHGAMLAKLLLENVQQQQQNALQAQQTEQVGVSTPFAPESATSAVIAPVQNTIPSTAKVSSNQLDWPPGFAGYIARYIYENAPRPVREVAIVATMGFLAGVCGKAFSIPQSGLNIYMILVARSAIGKEAMHSGIAALVRYMEEGLPGSGQFVDFTDYASGPALKKTIALNPCFVNVCGEWGRKLKRLAMEDGRDGPMQQLRTVMTDLYQKSGPQSMVGGLAYSDKEKNSGTVSGVSYSMIGETTPGTFYESLTEGMMEDGFMSRFTVVEYAGERPEMNTRSPQRPPAYFLEHLTHLASRVKNLIGENKHVEVQKSQDAYNILNDFNRECDAEINGTTDEGWRQMWNRAHLKTLRLSALLAVADNYVNPVILKEHAEWALDVIRRDIKMMQRRMEAGDVGVGDDARQKKLASVLAFYMGKREISINYRITQKMKDDNIVPRSYMYLNIAKASSFTTHRNGLNAALDSTIRAFMDNGYLVEVPKEKAVKDYGFNGKCFRITGLPDLPI